MRLIIYFLLQLIPSVFLHRWTIVHKFICLLSLLFYLHVWSLGFKLLRLKVAVGAAACRLKSLDF